MLFPLIVSLSASLVAATRAHTLFIKPHALYGSSVGVLGCKINHNRVAYWPSDVDCDAICVKVSHGVRSLHLLQVDESQGSYDISYDAWNYLVTGKSALEAPTTGGGVEMDYEFVEAEECVHLLSHGKLPLSASNSMTYLGKCLSQPTSWVAQNYELYNIPQGNDCQYGYDETCIVDLALGLNPVCPHILGFPAVLKGHTVVNIPYPVGQ
ncbi:hypothetical protein BDP55DRAFT_594802 [Colletotrichum godetiae]|uniref:Cerato-platanin n=1 Tax=Colletotrichum godetiae TaxID=1209918 RepID=A0AAJ0AAF9_9PEZI|nr:uncharacterized protein BDP55DRAFT_594802 [Colletotrichum godetiae]KAK1658046.1 hypothetical protein BDP55DRAFT_594802 [Colletotrichum godetiae]